MVVKIAFVSIALLIIAGSLAGAEMYKCTRADGTIYFSDSPVQSSGDCRMERVEELPPLGIIPDSPPQPAAPASAQRADAAPAGAAQTRSFAAFKDEAVPLVDQFDAAKRRSIRYSVVIDKQKALHELADIRAKKHALVNEIDQSALSDSEKQELRDVLAAITE